MSDFYNIIKQTAGQFRLLATQKLDSLRPDIQALLNSSSSLDLGKIEWTLDHLYDCVSLGVGKEEFEQLVEKLETLDTDAVKYYREMLAAKE